MSVFLWTWSLYFALVSLGYFLGKWRASLPSQLLKSEVRWLENQVRLRQLWAQARRYDVARLLRIYFRDDYPSGGRRKVLEAELERHARICGLTLEGSSAGTSMTDPIDLTDAEYRELAELVGWGWLAL